MVLRLWGVLPMNCLASPPMATAPHAQHGLLQGGLVEDDALRLHKDQRVGGTQIDGNVLAEHGLFFLAEGG